MICHILTRSFPLTVKAGFGGRGNVFLSMILYYTGADEFTLPLYLSTQQSD